MLTPATPQCRHPLETVIPAWDRYVSTVDSFAAVRLGALFTKMGKEYTLRGGRTTSLADLRQEPAVLIGAFNHEWSLRETGQLRFHFERSNGAFFVRDRLHPTNSAWHVQTDSEQPRIQTDYAIVSRVYDRATDHAVVIAGGIKGGGTEAAAEFLTNANHLKAALKNAPRGWKDKNLQFVLSTKTYSGTAGPPQVVAAHYW